jgi:2-(3-amino-3-carboxypropyl)histidine synthase
MEGDAQITNYEKKPEKKIINIFDEDKYKDMKEDKLLTLAISKLPSNYNFEIYKSLDKIKQISNKKKSRAKVALQFPDGLMCFSILISDILTTFGKCETIILGDITYGACCIDDIDCNILECDLLIHYCHSCLVPSTKCLVEILYIFVEINIDIEHLVKTIEYNFDKSYYLYLLASIQFNNSLFLLKRQLIEKGYDKNKLMIPQCKPRVQGEVLGCTSPKLDKKGENCVVIFICDGRFHMESVMIQNPSFIFYQYNPFNHRFTIEEYDHKAMKKIRFDQIEKFKRAKYFGIIFGTLGRQGNPAILKRLCNLLDKFDKKYVIIMLNEITQNKIINYDKCECFIQIACPRLSIDWSDQFSKPMLTPYEIFLALDQEKFENGVYKMNNYSNDTGEWGHFFKEKKEENINK